MHWFRAKRVATWLALFALACQLALTFGHIHIDRGGARSYTLAVTLDNDAAAGVPTSAPPNGPANGIDDLCAICASISLASTLFLPAAPALAFAASYGRPRMLTLGALEPESCDHVLFDARGPPRAG